MALTAASPLPRDAGQAAEAAKPSLDEARGRWREAFRRVRGGNRGARRAFVGGRPDRAVDGRCLADQMAPRPCHLVFRAVPAGAARSVLHDLRRALSLPVQLLLRRRRPAPCAPAARPDHAPERRGCRRLSCPCRQGGRAADRDRAGGGRAARVRDPRDRPASRAAAPGIADHRHSARLRAEPDRSGL